MCTSQMGEWNESGGVITEQRKFDGIGLACAFGAAALARHIRSA